MDGCVIFSGIPSWNLLLERPSRRGLCTCTDALIDSAEHLIKYKAQEQESRVVRVEPSSVNWQNENAFLLGLVVN